MLWYSPRWWSSSRYPASPKLVGFWPKLIIFSQIEFQLVSGVDLNRISLLYLLIFVKSQAPVNHPKPFSTFLWGDSEHPIPSVRVKNGSFQICQRLAKLVGDELILLNQPVQSVTYGKFPSGGKLTLSTSNPVFPSFQGSSTIFNNGNFHS